MEFRKTNIGKLDESMYYRLNILFKIYIIGKLELWLKKNKFTTIYLDFVISLYNNIFEVKNRVVNLEAHIWGELIIQMRNEAETIGTQQKFVLRSQELDGGSSEINTMNIQQNIIY